MNKNIEIEIAISQIIADMRMVEMAMEEKHKTILDSGIYRQKLEEKLKPFKEQIAKLEKEKTIEEGPHSKASDCELIVDKEKNYYYQTPADLKPVPIPITPGTNEEVALDTLIKARGKRVTVQAILQNFNDLRSQGESSEDVSRVKGVIQVLRNKFNVLKENKKYDPFFVNNSQYNLGCRVTHK